jgi:hypothetical protein
MIANLRDAFFRIASRALEAAERLCGVGIQEKAGFLTYHAFESCGGAFCHSRGIPYHPAAHPEKLRRFVYGARREKYAKEAATLAAEVQSLRNAFLYPRVVHGAIAMPEDVITCPQASRLTARMRHFQARVESSV